jgi:hypothetical protein
MTLSVFSGNTEILVSNSVDASNKNPCPLLLMHMDLVPLIFGNIFVNP